MADGFEALEARLRPNRRGAFIKISQRITSIERLRPWLVFTGVAGAFIAASAKMFADTAGTVMAIVGAVLGAFGGTFVALFDYRKLELGTHLAEVEAIAEDAIEHGRKLEAERDVARIESESLDQRRLAYRQASHSMREAIEQSILADKADVAGAV